MILLWEMVQGAPKCLKQSCKHMQRSLHREKQISSEKMGKKNYINPEPVFSPA